MEGSLSGSYLWPTGKVFKSLGLLGVTSWDAFFSDFPIFIKQIGDPEEPEPKRTKGSPPGAQDLQDAEDGALGTEEAPEDVIHSCFSSVTRLSGGEGENCL